MKLFLILFSTLLFSKDYYERLMILENQVSCQKQYNERQRIKNSEKNFQEYLFCIDTRVQYSNNRIMEENQIEVIQIFLTSKKEKAKNIVKRYNSDIKNNHLLNKSKAQFIERYIMDKSILEDGKYYKIVIFQDRIKMKKLLNNVHKVFQTNYKDAFITKIFAKEFLKWFK